MRQRSNAIGRLGSGGFTLTELLVVSVLCLVMLAVAYGVIAANRSQGIAGRGVTAPAPAGEQAVIGAYEALNSITDGLAAASAIAVKVPGLGAVTPGPYSLAVESDVDKDGTTEIVAYVAEDPGRIVEYVTDGPGTSAQKKVLLSGVGNRASRIPLFEYLDGRGSAVKGASGARAARVTIALAPRTSAGVRAVELAATVPLAAAVVR